MYFNSFSVIPYTIEIDGVEKVVPLTDITKNVRIRKEILSNVTLYDEYDVREGDTPEIIAERIYGNPKYHWIVMLTNDKYDYINDFPLEYLELQKYILDKYGEGNEYATHHYENERGFVVDQYYEGVRYEISNFQYEERENEKKRRIKVISPKLIEKLLNQFKEII